MFENYFSATLPNYPPGDSLPRSKSPVPVVVIERAVCQHFAIEAQDLWGRGREHAKAKQIYRYLLHDEGVSCRRIARMCGISQPAAYESIQTVKGYIDVGEPWIGDLWCLKMRLTKS